jgi:hypothetical protein
MKNFNNSYLQFSWEFLVAQVACSQPGIKNNAVNVKNKFLPRNSRSRWSREHTNVRTYGQLFIIADTRNLGLSLLCTNCHIII